MTESLPTAFRRRINELTSRNWMDAERPRAVTFATIKAAPVYSTDSGRRRRRRRTIWHPPQILPTEDFLVASRLWIAVPTFLNKSTCMSASQLRVRMRKHSWKDFQFFVT